MTTTVSIFINESKERAYSTAQQLQAISEELGFSLVTPKGRLAKALGIPEEAEQAADLALVIGGDGTLLSAARHYAKNSVPLLGINLGNLGFLAEVEVRNLRQAVKQVLTGDYHLDQRRMLAVRVYRDNHPIENYLGLNDVVVTRGTFARIITIDVLISGHKADQYRADGVIVASPTGSTAYSLAAGGPVVDPQAEVLIVTPICPHSLRDRSMVVRDREKVEIAVINGGGEIMLTVDGQVGSPLQPGDTIEVERAKVETRLIRLSGQGFYDVFRSRISGKGEEDSL